MQWRVTLSDGDVAALARQAVDLLGPDIAIDLEPDAGDDPYRRGPRSWLVYPLIDKSRFFGIHVESGATPADSLAHLLDQLSENAGETERFWGLAFPPCPVHPHPAAVSAEGDAVVLSCPDTGAEVGRIRPDAP